MLDNKRTFVIEKNSICIKDYPFEPSIAFKKNKITAEEITEMNIASYPPTIRIRNELIFLSKEHESELQSFADVNQINIVERDDIWSWILEPFLDTEYSIETDKMLSERLLAYGLTEVFIFNIRKEVKTQMLKYNFDTMLWEWVHLGALDVLLAMRTKYDKKQFADFYWRVMEIALFSKI